jgi:hypothetical protein
MTVIFSSYKYFLFHFNFASCNCCAIENVGSVRTLVNFSSQYDPILNIFPLDGTAFSAKDSIWITGFYKVRVISSGTGVETNHVLFSLKID